MESKFQMRTTKMPASLPTLLLLAIVLVLCDWTQTQTACPWDDAGLERWSNPATWDTNQIPGHNESVVIPKGKRILLDTPIPRLLTLIIEGALVWGDVDGIRLEVSYILVLGDFIIGSEECRMEKTVDIFLYGKSNSPVQMADYGRKFIGAGAGSKLSFHGKEKKSWSKLVATVSPVKTEPCGVRYDSKERRWGGKPGWWMNVWDSDGSFVELRTFTTVGAQASVSLQHLVQAIQAVPDGKIVALAVHHTKGEASLNYTHLERAIQELGGAVFDTVGQYEPYAMIAKKGTPDLTVEKHKRRSGGQEEIDVTVTFTFGELAYIARSYSRMDRFLGEVRFRILHKDAAFPKLSLLHDVHTWEAGDEIVVASTDYEWRQAEVKTIVQCEECAPNQVRVAGDFRYTHFGEVTYGIDERAEVGLLSRNIRIDAELQGSCYAFTEREKMLCERFGRDTFGGQLKILKDAWARIEGVQLTHMGQQQIVASYPLHFHLADEVPGQYLRNNVIRDSNSRCIVIHGTDRLEVSDNVCLNHLGHGIFLEDSAEQHNSIHRNLVIGTMHGTLLLTDMKPQWCPITPRACTYTTAWDLCHAHLCHGISLLSSYWITHPNNNFTQNVAAGSDGSGMIFAFSDRPLGPSYLRMKERGLYRYRSTRYTRVAEFSGNVMHSNQQTGLWFDNRVSYGQKEGSVFVPENGKLDLNFYTPRDPPNESGALVETVLYGLTLYKNKERNTWIRCGNIVISNSSFADSPASYVPAHIGTETYCAVRDSVFIGETANRGEPFLHRFYLSNFTHLPKWQWPAHQFDRSIARNRPGFMISGVSFYQGPIYLDNCYFDQFKNWYYNDSFVSTYGFRPVRPAAALNFHPNNHYPMIPTSGVRNLRFGFCDGENDSFRVSDGNASTPWWQVADGTRNSIIRDYDGSLTSSGPSYIIKDRPFFTGSKCIKKPDWGLSVCPYKYFLLVVRGKGGVLHRKYKGKQPVFIRRDDVPGDPFIQTGKTGNKYNLRVFKSYTVWFNSTLDVAPRKILFRALFGLEKNETVRIAVCLPKSTSTFMIYSTYPELHPRRNLLPEMVNSLAEVDEDTTMKKFFWDKPNGYLYFKMWSDLALNRPGQQCPGDACVQLTIARADGGDEPAVCQSAVPSWQVEDPFKKQEIRGCGNTSSVPLILTDASFHRDAPLMTSAAKGLGSAIETGFDPPPLRSEDTCPLSGQ